MDTVEHMRKWLADMDFDELESIDYDTRENCYYDAWEFWCKNAPVNSISSTYNNINELIACSEQDAESDEDCDD